MKILKDYVSAYERLTGDEGVKKIIVKKRLQAIQLDRFLDTSLREIKRLKKIRRKNIYQFKVHQVKESFIKN